MSETPSKLPRIFVAGVGPIPPESPDRLFAPGVRVWGIARELARAGHSVRLATVQFSGKPLSELFVRDLPPHFETGAPPQARKVAFAGEGLSTALAAEIESFGPAAIAGSTDLICRDLARAAGEMPLWCDYFGDPMAERQMLARLHGSDSGLADQWRTLVPALRRADRVSGCSRRQVGALLAELAVVGRLNRLTAEDDLAQLLPPWIEPIEPAREAGPFLRGPLAPKDAFIAVQSGGFNTWLDIETLAASLEAAMAREPRLHFAATGGAIPGHNEKSFREFEARAKASRFAGRFHLLGWLPLRRVPRVLAECDLGLNVDRPGPEGWLGTRNRIMDWILAGLPVVSTLGSELAQDLGTRGFISLAPQSNPEMIAETILEVAQDPEAASARASQGAAYLRTEHAPARCLAPLLAWARSPRPASDLHEWRTGTGRPSELWLAAGSAADRMAEAERLHAELVHLQARTRQLEGSRIVRWALWLRGRFGRG